MASDQQKKSGGGMILLGVAILVVLGALFGHDNSGTTSTGTTDTSFQSDGGGYSVSYCESVWKDLNPATQRMWGTHDSWISACTDGRVRDFLSLLGIGTPSPDEPNYFSNPDAATTSTTLADYGSPCPGGVMVGPNCEVDGHAVG